MRTDTLMIQGTTSDAGKSTLAAGLCRVLVRRGHTVAPFKPQNMALNSAVTQDGGEIGRAQAVQAQASRIEPHTDMNPVLLKPNSDIGAQVIVQGHALCNMEADAFHRYKPELMAAVVESFSRLQAQYECVVVEGAGSPAEINLRDRDIANMGFAESVDCPVWIIADIDRGGVFAHLVGTLALLSPSERNRITGFVINRFRGDISLLQPGIDWLEEETQIPVVGVLPYLHGLHMEAEDAIPREEPLPKSGADILRIAVLVFPRISNHTDFDVLRLHDQIHLQFVGPDSEIPDVDLIILPGSKSVIADLKFLKSRNWHAAILKHLRYGGKLMGICGGFQMMGEIITDPLGVEGDPESINGLGLLEMSTELAEKKKLKNVSGHLTQSGGAITGYEIHAGVSKGKALENPLVMIGGQSDGAISDDRQLIGSYVHGIFDTQSGCDELLEWAGLRKPESKNYFEFRESEIDKFADKLEQHLDLSQCFQSLQFSRDIKN